MWDYELCEALNWLKFRWSTERAEASLAPRRKARRSVGLAVATLGALVGAMPLASSPASAVSCVALPESGPTPEVVKEARESILAFEPEVVGGLEVRAVQVAENRSAFARGELTAEEATAQGGLALTGTMYVPALPVLYANTPAPPFSIPSMQYQLFSSANDESMASYYNENSYDQFFVDGDVLGFVTVDGIDLSYSGFGYGLNGGTADLVREAVGLSDGGTDFGLYDNDGPDGIPNSGDDDGYVDVLLLIQPEIGGECSGNDVTNIWSHHSYVTRTSGFPVLTNDVSANGGVILVDRYVVVPAISCDEGGGMIEIGVICHELGHGLGLPDLYDTYEEIAVLGDSQGIGVWGLMGAGNWNKPALPAHMTAHSKWRLGWLDYLDILQDGVIFLPPIETDPVAARVWSFGAGGPEYFLVENRQPIGFDANLKGQGLVIYHVDDMRYDAKRGKNRVNAYEIHKGIDVEASDAIAAGHSYEADDLDNAIAGNRGDQGDVWCGEDGRFNETSTPDTRAMLGFPTGVDILPLNGCSGDANHWFGVDFTVGVDHPVDLCIEDCDGDFCNEVATCEEWWATPNIWIDNDEDGIQDAPSWNIPNKIHFEMSNDGPESAAGTEVSLYLAPAAMGLEWPQDGTLLGSMTVPLLAPGAALKEHFVIDYPQQQSLDEGHWCMGVVLTHPQDAILAGYAPLTNNIAQVNEQVLVARAGTPVGPESRSTSGGSECPGPMSQKSKIYLLDGYNPFGKPRNVEVRIGTPPFYDDVVLPSNWTLDVQPGLGPYVVTPSVKDSITVELSSASAQHGQSAHVPLTLWDIDEDKMIGGAVIDASVDCYAPQAVENVHAEWIEFPGDDWGEHNVLVEWSHVTLDENSDPESLSHYEVYRTDGGGTETLVDRVIIDAEPETQRFQWYDYVVTAPCTDYEYRVRAVDLAGNVGAYSDGAILLCEVADLPGGNDVDGSDELPWNGLERSRAYPNPFASGTEIEFQTLQEAAVEVAIFDATGKRVRLLSDQVRGAGLHRVRWDGSDESGREMPSGIYFYRVRGGGVAEMKKIVRSR